MLLFPDALGIREQQLPQALILQKGCDQMPNICGTAATLGGA